jgi:UDP-3-O-[3-hydroxymyristoyl] glucosamine N-acyltransferase
MKLSEIASRVGGILESDDNREITGVAGMDEASDTELTFLSNPKYVRKLASTKAAAIIVDRDFALPADASGRLLLRSANPYLAFAKVLEIFSPVVHPAPVVHPTAVIAAGAKIGQNASIGAYVVIEEDVEVGDDCVLKSFVVIYRGARIGHRFFAHSHAVVREYVRIGDGVTLQNGAVIGSDGFGFAKQDDGSYYKIVQAGNALVEDNVEVQAHSCIDRATVGETRLRTGVKVDNLVQVGHGCDIGENTLLCAQAGLAGSSKTGRNVILTGQVGVAGHLTIGDNTIVTPQSGVPADVPADKIVSGSPAIDHYAWLKWSVLYPKLPEMYAGLRKLRELFASKDNRGEADKSA